MRIGMIIAIEKELKSFLESNYKVETLCVKNRVVYKTKINDNELYVIKSGCGEIDAASACQFLIDKFEVEIMLNYGVTGALVEGLAVSDLFVVKGAINHDFDTSCIDDVLPHQYLDVDSVALPLDNDLITLALSIKPDLRICNCASGDRFIEKLEDKNNLAKLDCVICDMEIAGIVRTCMLNNVRVLSIKCISDTIDGDGQMFVENVSKASAKAFDLIDKIMKAL